MSYVKLSIIGGHRSDGSYVNSSRRGHWSVASARAVAQKMGIVDGELQYVTSDMSGHGRGSEDGRFSLVTGAKIASYRDVDDSDDIHDTCDQIEAA